MLSIRQHLGEDLDGARELLLGHWSNPWRSDLQNQGVPWVAGSESDPWLPARRRQRSPARRVTFHIHIISIQKCPTYLESARIVERLAMKLVKLDQAARRLGCHVETLRLHIRMGRLRAVRGPHGAYYVDAEDLAAYPRPRRGWPPPEKFSAEELEHSWALVEGVLPKARAWRDRELALVDELHADPELNLRLYRLASAQRLRRLGLTFGQIAGELGITSRHARRLSVASLFLALRQELVRRDKARERADAQTERRTRQVQGRWRRWPPRRAT